MRYPSTRQDFSDLLLSTFKYYPRALLTLLPYALLLGVTSSLYFYTGNLPDNMWIKLIVGLIITMVQLYFWAAALMAMHRYFNEKENAMSTVFRLAGARFPSVLMGFFLSILIGVAVFYIGYLLTIILSWLAPENRLLYTILLMLFVSFPLMVIAVYLILFLPQLAVMEKGVGTALKDCFKKIGMANWIVTLILYVYVLLLLFLTYPQAHHMLWLRAHFLGWPFNLLLYVVLLPFIVNYTLLLLNRIMRLSEA